MKQESTATSIVLMHGLLEGRKSMKRLADFNCCRTSRRRVYRSHDLSMTSGFFVEWFKTQLLPALKTPHVIVMDNASFHPKNILDELCIQDKHFFSPLPPYSPDLNPIEQAWAIFKKKVTDLLREVPSIFECLERFFKTN